MPKIGRGGICISKKENSVIDNGIEVNTIVQGDSLRLLKTLKANSVDAVITDPPYSSGGQFHGDRIKSTRNKYLSTEYIAAEYAKHSFCGDNLDQRAWTSWMAEWLSLAREVTKAGGVAAIFVDWRQLGALCDAIQWAGWIWRGIMVWDKKNSRPQSGRPRQQCEFVVWASNGDLDLKRNAPIMPGIFTASPPTGNKRLHQTEKPLAVMRELVKLCERGGTILDPFAGSGPTCEAAILEGFNFIGIEKDHYYAEIAKERVSKALSNK